MTANDCSTPNLVAMMAREMQRVGAALDARIAHLKARLRGGVPDMTADEIQATIERAQGKRRELEQQRPDRRASCRPGFAGPLNIRL